MALKVELAYQNTLTLKTVLVSLLWGFAWVLSRTISHHHLLSIMWSF